MTANLVETPKLRIVRLDLDAVTAAIEDRSKFERMVGARLDDDWPLKDMKDLLTFMKNQLGKDSGAMHWGGVIVARDPDTVVGDIGFHASPVSGEVEVGYSIVPSHRKRGLATEALRAFLKWGFQHPDVARVIARCEHSNLASQRVLEKVGFLEDGRSEIYFQYVKDRN
jgi:RimJ/RimL family protein N-acetyltransferase